MFQYNCGRKRLSCTKPDTKKHGKTTQAICVNKSVYLFIYIYDRGRMAKIAHEKLKGPLRSHDR